jgi:peptide-methionine (S)-S-oxide reductase
MNEATSLELATLAGGCFWCLEAVLREITGVEKVVSGYTGGDTANPTYEQVCDGKTGHAEAVQISFDPSIISYREILEIFFSIHDPTTLNRQGADVGAQYRSAIFYHSEQQKNIAEDIIVKLNAAHLWKNSIVTQPVPLRTFYPAEDYQQGYFGKHPEQGYCLAVISPKLNRFRQQWSKYLKQ